MTKPLHRPLTLPLRAGRRTSDAVRLVGCWLAIGSRYMLGVRAEQRIAYTGRAPIVARPAEALTP